MYMIMYSHRYIYIYMYSSTKSGYKVTSLIIKEKTRLRHGYAWLHGSQMRSK